MRRRSVARHRGGQSTDARAKTLGVGDRVDAAAKSIGAAMQRLIDREEAAIAAVNAEYERRAAALCDEYGLPQGE